jgi:D-tyrosyl-tRNA(Tyr) deacylase
MRVVLQRVTEAHVNVTGATVGAIKAGLLVLVGVASSDTAKDAEHLADKIVNLRVFEDESRRMNRSLIDTSGALLVISQFTLYGDCRKGRRPSFDEAAPPEMAKKLYEYFIECLRRSKMVVQTGVFQADMQVHLVNDGPVTFVLDSTKNS